uniref:carboxy-terminal domain RNA polymerase II polypeptide A small phosphatase 2-like isoform X2 n=1 Tax=Erigeron canadensis TaxID=72917 RepID=UPI001CB8D6D9|nr:carboxy-terminal domain RNA polymerase II polypeptide A small phosphatase 2-like isoform X2 [Erigeron canadensis]
MPSLKMKMKSTMGCLREKNGLHVCQKSSKISKNSFSQVRTLQQEAQLEEACYINKHHDSFCSEAIVQELRCNETDCCELLDEESIQDHTQDNCSSNIDTIFSPILESIDNDGEALASDDRDMTVSSPPMERGSSYSITEATCLPDYGCYESNLFFDDEYMILPFLEDSVDTRNDPDDCINHSEAVMVSEESNLYLAIHQLKSSNQDPDVNLYPDWDPSECLDPQMFIRNLPDLSEVGTNLCPATLPGERKTVTLVLDLDETLVHSSLEHSDDADFTFPVLIDSIEHTVYVKQRPYLKEFLERVSKMFQIVVFTASQSIYAKQLLDILDPDGKIISHRAYRESCTFSDGSYTKDLTVLGVDLAKIVIIDNCPQVFQLQVNNGIPIRSWFSDPSDCALLSLLPFLEILADAEDVRPIIAKRYGNKE